METDREIICPYCKCEFVDSWIYDYRQSGLAERVECHKCGKSFRFMTKTDYITYSDCALNGEDHDWQVNENISEEPWIWYECSKCDEIKREDKE